MRATDRAMMTNVFSSIWTFKASDSLTEYLDYRKIAGVFLCPNVRLNATSDKMQRSVAFQMKNYPSIVHIG